VRYKVGDKVRIRSKRWIDAQEKDAHGNIDYGPRLCLFSDLFDYAGKIARITRVYPGEYESYDLDLNDGGDEWADWMFDPDYNPDTPSVRISPTPLSSSVRISPTPLSSSEAIRIMLDGETLYDRDGEEYLYEVDNKEVRFVPEIGTITETWRVPETPLYRKQEKCIRPMTQSEAISWKNSKDCWGWMVRISTRDTWGFPSQFLYEFGNFEYQRARLLPDFSGIDESTIQGFMTEEAEDTCKNI
jgi:hypothetical protein